MTEQRFRKTEASADVATHAAANREARQTWQGEVNAIASSAGVNLAGRSPDEIERLARAMRFGKGAHEQPFVSEAEYVDPLQSGFPIGSERDRADGDGFRAATVVSEDKPQIADNTGELDKFRAKARHRARMKSNGEDGA